MSSSNSLANGTYYITAKTQGTSLRFVTGEIGELLTTWNFMGGADQQWEIATNATMYTVKNVQHGTYITYQASTAQGAQNVTSSLAPFGWFVEPFNDGYVFSTSPAFTLSWNVEDGFSRDDNPVIMWPIDANATNSIFLFNSTGAPPSSTGSSPTSSSPNPTNSGSADQTPGASHGADTGPIIGGVVGGVVLLGFVVIVTLILRKKRMWCFRRSGYSRTSNNPNMTDAGVAHPDPY